MKRILYTATSDIHLNTFHIPYLKWMKSQGFEVHLAIENRGNIDLNFCDRIHYIKLSRSPIHTANIIAYRDLKSIMRAFHFDLIHCHTPAISMLTRLAAIPARRTGTTVMYTAHGFHFFKGAPLKYWLLFYPVEKLLSAFTDAIVTINREDFELAKEKFWCKHAFLINGIGVNTEKFKTVSQLEKHELRIEYKIEQDAFVLLYVAEFIPRKNHEFIIRSMAELRRRVPSVKVIFAGTGALYQKMISLAQELGVSDNISFLGWRNDVGRLASLSDIGISSSRQEGLGLGLAEEMLCSIPIVASNDRGHREMVEHGVNGFLYDQDDRAAFISYIEDLFENREKRIEFGQKAYKKAQKFLIGESLRQMKVIYESFLAKSASQQ